MVAVSRELYSGEKKKSLFGLFGDLPNLVRELIAGEIELLKSEMLRKLKVAGVALGLLAGAAVILLLFVGVLLTAAILGLATVMPGWLAALIVAFVLLIVIVVLVLIGIRTLKRALPPLPTQTIDGLKKDLNVVKGVGKRD